MKDFLVESKLKVTVLLPSDKKKKKKIVDKKMCYETGSPFTV